MERILLNFNEFNPLQQEWFLTETWCDTCQKADLGIVHPIYYKEGRKSFVEGRCKVCGTIQTTQIVGAELNH